MGEDSREETTGGKHCCGYEYMLPGYILEEKLEESASYPDIANALLENSSAHGLPTIYRAQGN